MKDRVKGHLLDIGHQLYVGLAKDIITSRQSELQSLQG